MGLKLYVMVISDNPTKHELGERASTISLVSIYSPDRGFICFTQFNFTGNQWAEFAQAFLCSSPPHRELQPVEEASLV